MPTVLLLRRASQTVLWNKPLFIPGPYATGRNFKTAYEAMAQKAGLTMCVDGPGAHCLRGGVHAWCVVCF